MNPNCSPGSALTIISGYVSAIRIPAGKRQCGAQGGLYNRSNLFVPVPHFTQIEQYNQKLLKRHEKKASELHYKKQAPIGELFDTDNPPEDIPDFHDSYPSSFI